MTVVEGGPEGRFVCVPEPSGTWTVWDCETNAPAELGGSVLVGRTRQRADVACAILTRIYRNGLNAGSGRTDTLR